MEHNNSSQQIAQFEVSSQSDALQLLVYFINLAQKRGTYTIEESAKIYECIKLFTSPQPSSRN